MKIVIDARTMGSKPSGIGMYTFYYIKELMKSKYELILLTDVIQSQEMQFVQEHKVKVIAYGTSIYRSVNVLKYFCFMREQLRDIQPDFFWEPNILLPTQLTGYKGKTIVTIHDMFPVTHGQYFGRKYGIYFRCAFKRTIKALDMVLYDSYETKEIAEKLYPMLKQKKTFVQYVIVPKMEHNGDCNGQGNIENLEEKDYFLYVGNMEKRKGVDLLLDAYDLYRKRGGNKALILAGKSREKDVDEKIKDITKKYNNVVYYGYVGNEDKRYLYQNCSCFLFPSKAEGFGICVIEAMNYYKPIIASNLSIFKEIAGESIMYFSLRGDTSAQLDNLCQKMLGFDLNIDRITYDMVMERYLPEQLGKKLIEILQESYC